MNRVRVILAGSGQFHITPLDFLLVLQLVVVGEEAHSKVDVDTHLGVDKLKFDNTEKLKKTLPKAQRTRGLSSYHKFLHKS